MDQGDAKLEETIMAIQSLNHDPDPRKNEMASVWLHQLQTSNDAWEVRQK